MPVDVVDDRDAAENGEKKPLRSAAIHNASTRRRILENISPAVSVAVGTDLLIGGVNRNVVWEPPARCSWRKIGLVLDFMNLSLF